MEILLNIKEVMKINLIRKGKGDPNKVWRS